MNHPLKALMLGLALLSATSTLHAQNMCGWILNGGNMNDPTGWSTYPGLPMPVAGDWLWITGGNTMNITADFQGGIPEYVYVGRTYEPYGFTGDGAILQTGGNLVLNTGIRGIGRGGSAGTYTMQGGTLTMRGINSGVPLLIGQDGGSSGTMTLWNNSEVTAVGEGHIGFGGSGSLTLNDTSKFSITSLVIGDGSSGSGSVTLNNSSSLTTALTINATGAVNLNGASTLSTPQVTFGEWASLNADGGTIKATASSSGTSYFMNYQGIVYINAGGAAFDTNGYDILVDAPLVEGTTAGGGLTKKGAGTLTLRQTNTYTGATSLLAGGIRLENSATLPGNLTVPAGCSFGGLGTLGGTLTTQNNSTLKFTTGEMLSLNAPPIVNATTIVEPTYTNPAFPASSWTIMQWTTVTGEANPVPNMKPSVDSMGLYALSLSYGPDASDATKSDVNILANLITNEWKGPVGNNNYSTVANWTNHVPSGGAEISLFGTAGTAGAVNVDSPRTLSSLIFNNSSSYALSGSQLTLNSSIASNSQITVMQGVHTIGNNLALAKNTLVHVNDSSAFGYSLTLDGVVSGAGNLTIDGGGKVVLSQPNTFTGKVSVTNCTVEFPVLGNVAVPNSLGQSGAAPENFRIKGGTLHYTGTAAASTDRGFTLEGNINDPANSPAGMQLDGDVTFTGRLAGAEATLVKSGSGKMILNNTASTNDLNKFIFREGELVLKTGTVANVGALSVADGPGYVGKLTMESNAKVQGNSTYILGANGGGGSLVMQDGSSIAAGTLQAGYKCAGQSTDIEMRGDSRITVAGDTSLGTDGTIATLKMNYGEPEGKAKIVTGTLNVGQTLGSGIPTAPATIEMYGHSSIEVLSNVFADATFGRRIQNNDLNFTMNDYASLSVYNGWMFIGEGNTGYTGVVKVTLNDHATINNPSYEGKGIGHCGATGIVTLNDDAVWTIKNGDFYAGWSGDGSGGGGGNGTLNIRDHAKMDVAGGHMAIGCHEQSVGLLDIQGGTFLHEGASNDEYFPDHPFMGFIFGIDGAGTGNIGQSSDPTPIPGLFKSNTMVILGLGANNRPSKGIMNINVGGTVEALGVTSSGAFSTATTDGTLNFNGGTLKAIADNDKFIAIDQVGLGGTATLDVKVLGGGAIIDTQTFDVTAVLPFASGVTVGSTDGGLTKKGAGILRLAADPSYNGDTTVDAGTLAVGNLNTPSATVFVAQGGTLNAGSIIADTLQIGGTPPTAVAATVVPEPSTMSLILFAFVGLLASIWRKRKA